MIQRVPPTERRGRVHTSTVTVAVLEYPSEQAIEILDKDLVIEWFSGTGPTTLGHRSKLAMRRFSNDAEFHYEISCDILLHLTHF